MACLFGHKWNGCKCERCGATRDEQHNWDTCQGKCLACSKTCTAKHEWKSIAGKFVEVCSKCGAKQATMHDWKGDFSDISDDPKDLKEIFSPEDLGIGSVFRLYNLNPPKWDIDEWCKVVNIDYEKKLVGYLEKINAPSNYHGRLGHSFESMFYGYGDAKFPSRCFIPTKTSYVKE